jgi:hypothetical protein
MTSGFVMATMMTSSWDVMPVHAQVAAARQRRHRRVVVGGVAFMTTGMTEM